MFVWLLISTVSRNSHHFIICRTSPLLFGIAESKIVTLFLLLLTEYDSGSKWRRLQHHSFERNQLDKRELSFDSEYSRLVFSRLNSVFSKACMNNFT